MDHYTELSGHPVQPLVTVPIHGTLHHIISYVRNV